MKIVHTLQMPAHGSLTWEHIAQGDRGVTGSESAMLWLAQAQAQAGHRVTVYCPTETKIQQGIEFIDQATGAPRYRRMDTADIVIAWLSSGTLQCAPPSALRVCSVQINDWLMNVPGYDTVTDLFIAVSEAHRAHLWSLPNAPRPEVPVAIIPNMVDCAMIPSSPGRVPYSCAYLSSPDRGLHWLLAAWPEIRLSIPDATLHIYYEINQWLETMTTIAAEPGQRARYVGRKLDELKSHGVMVHGAVPPKQLMQDLVCMDAMLYPCDPLNTFTEGFSVSTVTAAACGAVPIITDADALGEVYGDSGAVVVPRTRQGAAWMDDYVDTVIRTLDDRAQMESRRSQVAEWAQRYDVPRVANQWMTVLDAARKKKRETV